MAVKSSLDWNRKLQPNKNVSCKACGLYIDQPPVVTNASTSEIFWVGLSAVRFEEGIEKLPLSPYTNTGALIEKIELPLRKSTLFYKTNLVKCAPLKGGKIRYPHRNEMEKCYPNFEHEIRTLKPSKVFLLGKQVASFVLNKYSIKDVNLCKEFNYNHFVVNGISYIPIHHPSYILVYKRKHLNKYVASIRALCKNSNVFSQSESSRNLRKRT